MVDTCGMAALHGPHHTLQNASWQAGMARLLDKIEQATLHYKLVDVSV